MTVLGVLSGRTGLDAGFTRESGGFPRTKETGGRALRRSLDLPASTGKGFDSERV